MGAKPDSVSSLARQISACRICRDHPQGARLPHEPNPVAILSNTAKIAICGQAPGNKVHQSGNPFTDPSGVRLREWLETSEEEFYDPDRFAIVPMGFCFPGYDKHGGDKPPRKECRQHWHERVFAAMPQLQVKLLIGGSAQSWHLGSEKMASVTETVRCWRQIPADEHGVLRFPLPHPSWRNTGWLKKNPWFASELLPELRELIQRHL